PPPRAVTTASTRTPTRSKPLRTASSPPEIANVTMPISSSTRSTPASIPSAATIAANVDREQEVSDTSCRSPQATALLALDGVEVARVDLAGAGQLHRAGRHHSAIE